MFRATHSCSLQWFTILNIPRQVDCGPNYTYLCSLFCTEGLSVLTLHSVDVILNIQCKYLHEPSVCTSVVYISAVSRLWIVSLPVIPCSLVNCCSSKDRKEMDSADTYGALRCTCRKYKDGVVTGLIQCLSLLPASDFRRLTFSRGSTKPHRKFAAFIRGYYSTSRSCSFWPKIQPSRPNRC